MFTTREFFSNLFSLLTCTKYNLDKFIKINEVLLVIIMVKETKIIVNGEEVPLNPFVTRITSKLVLAIVESLKGLEENIKEVQIKVKY